MAPFNVFSLSLWERAGVRASACAFPLTLNLSLKGEGTDRAHYCTALLTELIALNALFRRSRSSSCA
ncbi:hypothetical protein D4679_04655 [Escherichia coli]|nr:hypothetical protein [Escherichia coli]EEW8933919.1 hypothetical protein [Escherichia coli]EFO0912626.1 hypothetical protein [Escherichia coli]EFO1719707.1 hypothetical protein [Escherichia coli]EFO4732488.1 hypothetical protein [Escherichia coli]